MFPPNILLAHKTILYNARQTSLGNSGIETRPTLGKNWETGKNMAITWPVRRPMYGVGQTLVLIHHWHCTEAGPPGFRPEVATFAHFNFSTRTSSLAGGGWAKFAGWPKTCLFHRPPPPILLTESRNQGWSDLLKSQELSKAADDVVFFLAGSAVEIAERPN